MVIVNKEQAYVEAKNKLNEIVAMVSNGEYNARQMWETVLMIRTYPFGVYELFFNCGNNTLSRINGKLENRKAVTAEYNYINRSNNQMWNRYLLNRVEQQAVLDFALALQDYLQPTIVKPEIVSFKII